MKNVLINKQTIWTGREKNLPTFQVNAIARQCGQFNEDNELWTTGIFEIKKESKDFVCLEWSFHILCDAMIIMKNPQKSYDKLT